MSPLSCLMKWPQETLTIRAAAAFAHGVPFLCVPHSCGKAGLARYADFNLRQVCVGTQVIQFKDVKDESSLVKIWTSVSETIHVSIFWLNWHTHKPCNS